MKIRLGQTENGKEVSLDVDKLFKERLLFQGISNSWKSETINIILQKLKLGYEKEYKVPIQQFIFDWEGERRKFQNFGEYIILGKDEGNQGGLTVEEAFEYGQEARRDGVSVIIDLSTWDSMEDREMITDQFIKGILLDNEKKYWKPCVVMIDEGQNLIPQTGKSRSRDSIIRLCETGRKRNTTVIIATQGLAYLHKRASSQLANRIIGRTIELAHREMAKKLLGLPRDAGKKLAELQGGEFYVFGNAFDAIDPVKFKVDNRTPTEIEGYVLRPDERLDNIKDSLQKLVKYSDSRKDEEIDELRLMIQELAKSVGEAELTGYDKAMTEVETYLKELQKHKKFYDVRKIIPIEFVEKTVDGIRVLTIKKSNNTESVIVS